MRSRLVYRKRYDSGVNATYHPYEVVELFLFGVLHVHMSMSRVTDERVMC